MTPTIADLIVRPSSHTGLGADVFTTGLAAKICRVAPRTVTGWFDRGLLKGYRIPESKDRRIPRQHLIDFMKLRGLPLPPEFLAGINLAICIPPFEAGLKLNGWTIADAFEAGAIVRNENVNAAIVGDECGVAVGAKIASAILRVRPAARVVLLVSEDAPQVIPGWAGKVVRRPVDLAAVAAELVEGGK